MQSDSTQVLLRSLRVIRRFEEGRSDNVCFHVTQRAGRIANEELFFGIVRNAVTRWHHTPAEGFSLRVYSSPDAGYILRWTDPGVIGHGEGLVIWLAGQKSSASQRVLRDPMAQRARSSPMPECRHGDATDFRA